MHSCECGGQLVTRQATDKNPYRYAVSGVRDLFLVGIEVRKCCVCQAEEPIIPKIANLHCVVFHRFLHQVPLLRGDQLRFARKHAGVTATEFARIIHIDPSHLSRVETGATETLGPCTDHLARIIVAAVSDCVEINGVKVIVLQQAQHAEVSLRFRLGKTKWAAV